MKLKSLIAASLVLIIVAPLHAKPLEQTFPLNHTYPIPAADGGARTYFDVTPRTGRKYTCDVTSEGESTLRIWVNGGKNYHTQFGNGYYRVHPKATIVVEGYFTDPTDEDNAGELRFRRISGKGSVTCTSAS